VKKLKKTKGSLQPGVTNVTTEDTMCDYLDANRSIFAFRRAVPEDLQPFIFTKTGKPRTEWRYSLKTNDRRLANERCHIETVLTDRLLEKARADRQAWLVASAKSPQERQRERLQWEGELEASELTSQELLRHERAFEEREPARQALIATLGRPRAELSSAEMATRDLIPDDEFDTPDVKAKRQRKIEREWAEGEAEAAEQFAATRSGAAAKLAYFRIMDVFEDYAAEGPLKPSTHKRWKAVLENLVAFLGYDDANKVTRQDVIAWKDALLSEVDEDGQKKRGNRTVSEVFLAASKATFTWGMGNGRNTENPFSSVTVKVRKRRRLRDPDFTEDEGLLILRSALAPQSELLAPRHALARRWVPWICAYTGARVNEITQMRAEDVKQIKDVWTIRITPEAGGQKNDKARVIPIHAHIVEQGFPEVATAQAKGPLFYDPSRSRGGSAAHPQYKKVGERLAAWVRKIGVDDPEVQPNHAWRHLFKSRARNAGMDLDAREAIAGHEPGTEGRRYGVNDIPFLAAEIAKLPRFKV
jgi:integrase